VYLSASVYVSICVSVYIRPNVCVSPLFFMSEFLATDPEVPGSIPGPTRFSDK
jgi:hypothetical protein